MVPEASPSWDSEGAAADVYANASARIMYRTMAVTVGARLGPGLESNMIVSCLYDVL